jgi:sulfur carrier protein ThiS adenylyltransferase
VRQRGLVPPAALAACHALVIGVGAIGRHVALQLAAVGVPRLTLFDDDTVGPENLAAQGYWQEDLDRLKVEATAALCRRIHPQADVTPHAQRFRRSTAPSLTVDGRLAVFCCMDAIGTRRLLWEALRGRAELFIDGRMSGEVIRVLASDAPAVDASYPTTLFDPADAYAGACTARSTIYAASVAAGLMVGQLAKWLRGLPVDPDLTLNLLAAELSALSPPLA